MNVKNIIYCFLFLFLYSCIPYKSYQKTDTICEVGMEFQEYEKTLSRDVKPLLYQWQEIDSGNYLFTYVSYGHEGVTIAKWSKKDSISKYLKYDTLGRIKSIGYTYDRVNIGTSYFFDTLGNISKTIDERQADRYPICFREALEIVKRKIPTHYVISALERDSSTVEGKKIYYWEVNTRTPRKPYQAVVYRLSGKTGRVIKKYKAISVRD